MPQTFKYTRIWKIARKEGTDLVSLGAAYLQSLIDRNYSPSTHQARYCYLGFFLAWCDERNIHMPALVTRELLEEYLLYLGRHYSERSKATLSANSRRRHFQAVQIFFKWLHKKRHIPHNPATEFEMGPQPKHLPRKVLTAMQAEAIINAPDIESESGLRDRAILETLYSTGIRAKEIVGLQITDIDVKRGTLFVRHGKGDKDRVVPIGERALAWIDKYVTRARHPKPGVNTLFLTQYGKPFTTPTVLASVIRDYIRAGTGDSGGCHIFRHSMATLMLENGADVRHIQEILGHTDLRTTALYTRVSIPHLRRVHARSHPAELQTPDDPLDLPVPAPPLLASPKRQRGRRRTVDEFWNRPPQFPDDFLSLGNRVFSLLQAENYSPETIQSLRIHLKAFVLWCRDISVSRPADVSERLIERYQSHLALVHPHTGKSLAPRSRQNRMSLICTFFRRLFKTNLIVHDPTTLVEPIKASRRLPCAPLSHLQVKSLLAQPNLATTKGIRDRAMLETIYSTGLRRSEIAALQLSDIDFTRGTLLVRDGKGQKDRYVPIGENALHWLEAYIEKTRPLQIIDPDQHALFITKEGTPLHRHRVSIVTTAYFKAAGLQGSSHTLRHTMASLMLENGADIRHIQEILGHASLSTTEIYTRVNISTLKDVHNRTHPAQMHPTESPKILADLRENPPKT